MKCKNKQLAQVLLKLNNRSWWFSLPMNVGQPPMMGELCYSERDLGEKNDFGKRFDNKPPKIGGRVGERDLGEKNDLSERYDKSTLV